MRLTIFQLPQVKENCGLSRLSIYSMMKKGAFLQSFCICAKAIDWKEADIIQWIEDRAEIVKTIS